MLDRLKEQELQILLHVGKILDRNGIKYYLIGGSTIGAVRHKGFIPWDDDIDIAILHEDEEKFIKIMVNELGDQYFLQGGKKDKNTYFPYYKVRKNNTTCIEGHIQHLNVHKGIYIDVFVLYGIQENKIKSNILRNIYYFYSRLCFLEFGSNNKNNFKNFFKKCIKPFRMPVIHITKSLIDFLNQLFQCDKSKNISNVFGTIEYEKSIMPREYFGEPVYKMFEGYELPCPAMTHEYLTHIFGDYMKYPPEDQRTSGHNFVIVDCDKSYLEYEKNE